MIRRFPERGWVDLGPIEEIPLGQGRCYRFDGQTIAVFRLRDGAFRALDAVCPHRGGLLCEGLADPEKVLCPLHGFAFSLATGKGAGHPLSVRSHAVRSSEGRLILRMPRKRKARGLAGLERNPIRSGANRSKTNTNEKGDRRHEHQHRPDQAERGGDPEPGHAGDRILLRPSL